MTKRTIALVTGSRGEWGYIRPLLREIEASDDFDHALIVTNLHLLTDFGHSVTEIENDRVRIADRIFMALDGYTPASMAKSLGVFLMGVTDALVRIKPHFVLLAGDRGEQFMAAVAASHMNIPVAHIQAGELSGNIDGITRHAIARFAHLHFASNEEAAARLRRTGEEDFRVFVTGAPQLDDLVGGDVATRDEVARLCQIDPASPTLLFVQHPVTEEYDEVTQQVEETLSAICDLGVQTVAVFPNNDAGSEEARRALERSRRPFIRIERNLPRRVYAGLMGMASAMVGNSSSGLIEAPLFRLPAVNVGDRQRGRVRGRNVIDVPCDRAAIKAAIERAMSPAFRAELGRGEDNPYLGNGQAARTILDILRRVRVDERLLKKQLAY